MENRELKELNHIEQLRSEISKLKERGLDIHLTKIDPNELTDYDLMIFEKAKKYDLTKEDMQAYAKELRECTDKKKKIMGDQFKATEDSRCNFFAMLKNMLMVEDYQLKHQKDI